ncbi:excalibur calcium-binding domain-containing protein [Microbacteriaceae bacterium MWH-Ta3]|nr:excalibur calcium-binding domain-containing protein [Microbacteriaceae bacterium MWH-Ta3]
MSRLPNRISTWGAALLAILLFGGIVNLATGLATGTIFGSVADPGISASESPNPSATTPAGEETPAPEPTPTESNDEGSGQVSGEVDTALELLYTLPVKPWDTAGGYDRDNFGDSWEDVDGNGCDTRNDILRRDFETITAQESCKVLRGTIDDPYTGQTITFVRGQDTSAEVQIDHMVALSNAWRTGARTLSWDMRVALANDPLNLLAVDGPTNGAKSDSDASQWLPPRVSYHCAYVAKQISVKAAYTLWVTASEKAAMIDVLEECPTQRMYTSTYPRRVASGTLLIPAGPSASGSGGTVDSGGTYVYPAGAQPWASCAAARAAGAAPVLRGTPGYAPRLDRDGDGVGCE